MPPADPQRLPHPAGLSRWRHSHCTGTPLVRMLSPGSARRRSNKKTSFTGTAPRVALALPPSKSSGSPPGVVPGQPNMATLKPNRTLFRKSRGSRFAAQRVNRTIGGFKWPETYLSPRPSALSRPSPGFPPTAKPMTSLAWTMRRASAEAPQLLVALGRVGTINSCITVVSKRWSNALSAPKTFAEDSLPAFLIPRCSILISSYFPA